MKRLFEILDVVLDAVNTASTVGTGGGFGTTPSGSLTLPQWPAGPPPLPSSQDEDDEPLELGYRVELPCLECGAPVPTAVLAHATRCPFCSQHLMVHGHGNLLHLALPIAIEDAEAARQALLDQFRLEFYQQLLARRTISIPDDIHANDAQRLSAPTTTAATNFIEAQVDREATVFRSRLEGSLKAKVIRSFAAPWAHGLGTLYQAAFGRDSRSHEKVLNFALKSLEAARPAFDGVDLPKMGKLSYLKALVPAASLPAQFRTLKVVEPRKRLEETFAQLEKRRLVKDIQVLRVGSVFAPEVFALVWRGFLIVSVDHPRHGGRFLVDASSGQVHRDIPLFGPEQCRPMSTDAREPAATLRFQTMQCPVCGFELRFVVDAILHFCPNCHRVYAADGENKHEIDYAWQSPSVGQRLVPFWCFPLDLKTGTGELMADLGHLTDGVDGTLDQLGEDAEQDQDFVFVPAIWIRSQRLMTKTFNALFKAVHASAQSGFKRGLFPLDDETPEPLPVIIDHDEARRFLPMYLANAFGPRDLARANAPQVADWLFAAEQRRPGRLVYLAIEEELLGLALTAIGRSRSTSIQRVQHRDL